MEIHGIVLFIFILMVLRFVINKIRVKVAFLKAYAKSNCAEPRVIPSKDPIFGLDLVLQMFRQLKEHRRMKSIHELFQRYGHTYQSFPFGRRSVSTIHPRNLQFVFTETDTFGVGPLRERASQPMIGRGIVSSDGVVWEDARIMIRPTFNRTQIADRQMFSNHVEKFLRLLPRNNSVVDLQPLFDRLVRWFPLSENEVFSDEHSTDP